MHWRPSVLMRSHWIPEDPVFSDRNLLRQVNVQIDTRMNSKTQDATVLLHQFDMIFDSGYFLMFDCSEQDLYNYISLLYPFLLG